MHKNIVIHSKCGHIKTKIKNPVFQVNRNLVLHEGKFGLHVIAFIDIVSINMCAFKSPEPRLKKKTFQNNPFIVEA